MANRGTTLTAQQLRAALRKLGVTPYRAARLLHLAPSTVTRMCRGVSPVSGPVAAVVHCWQTHGIPSCTAQPA